jgi:threonine/homoserine/homoserine lactone efflux protein
MFFTPEMILMITTYMAGVMSPGPDFVMIVRNSASSTRTTGIMTALGLASGIFIHNTYSILGFGLFLKQYPIILQVVKYIGASYLSYIAFQCFKARKSSKNSKTDHSPSAVLTNWQAFRMGFITDVSNPNAAFFIISLFSGIANIPMSHLLVCSFLLAGLTFAWYGFVAVSLTHPPLQEKFIGHKHWINWTAGCFLIFFALRLVLS